MPHRLISVALVLSTIFGVGISPMAAELIRSPIVVCTREVGNPWSLFAHGELVTTKSGTQTQYQLEVAGHTFQYIADSLPDGSPGMSFPPSVSLIRTLVEKSAEHTTPRGPIVVPKASYSLTVDPNGNIREYAMLPTVGPLALVTVAGSSCPPAGEGLRPNRVYGLLPRNKRNAVGRSTRESVAVVYPASDVSILVLVPTWNLRTGSHTF
jgi:hypothetical protein